MATYVAFALSVFFGSCILNCLKTSKAYKLSFFVWIFFNFLVMKNPLIKIFEDTYKNTFEYNFLELFKEEKDKIDKSEILIFYLWLISKIFKDNPDFLDELHQIYADKKIFSKEKIMERYGLYYKEWDDINIENQELLAWELCWILWISAVWKSFFINQFINLSYLTFIDIKEKLQLEWFIINSWLHKKKWDYIYSWEKVNYDEYTLLWEKKNWFQKLWKDKFIRYIDETWYLDFYKKFNFVDENWQVISKIDFDDIEDFQENSFSIVKLYNEDDYNMYSKLLHKSGYLIKDNFEEIYDFEENWYALVKINWWINIIDNFWNIRFNKNFEETTWYSEWYYTFKYEWKWNFMDDKNFKFISSTWFDQVLPFEKWFGTVMKINNEYNWFISNYIDINWNLLFDNYYSNEYELNDQLMNKIDSQNENWNSILIISLCNLWINNFPENSFYYYVKSLYLYEELKKIEAIDVIQEAINLDPEDERFLKLKNEIISNIGISKEYLKINLIWVWDYWINIINKMKNYWIDHVEYIPINKNDDYSQENYFDKIIDTDFVILIWDWWEISEISQYINKFNILSFAFSYNNFNWNFNFIDAYYIISDNEKDIDIIDKLYGMFQLINWYQFITLDFRDIKNLIENSWKSYIEAIYWNWKNALKNIIKDIRNKFLPYSTLIKNSNWVLIHIIWWNNLSMFEIDDISQSIINLLWENANIRLWSSLEKDYDDIIKVLIIFTWIKV